MIQVLSADGNAISTQVIGPNEINDSWTTQTRTLTISVQDLDANGNFRVKYSTVDNGGVESDGWVLGRTGITATAIK